MKESGHSLIWDITPVFACSDGGKWLKPSVGFRAELSILDISNTKQESILYIRLLIL
jgi:hypothetical protein